MKAPSTAKWLKIAVSNLEKSGQICLVPFSVVISFILHHKTLVLHYCQFRNVLWLHDKHGTRTSHFTLLDMSQPDVFADVD